MKFTAENMGKVKIPMIYKKDAALRRKWFNDRKNGMIQKVKNGVIKKVKELGKLISAKVLLLMQNTEKDDILCVTSRDEKSVKKCLSKAGFKGKLEYELIPNPVENSHDNDACFAAASDVNGYKGCPLVHLLLSLLGFHPVLHLQHGFLCPHSLLLTHVMPQFIGKIGHCTLHIFLILVAFLQWGLQQVNFRTCWLALSRFRRLQSPQNQLGLQLTVLLLQLNRSLIPIRNGSEKRWNPPTSWEGRHPFQLKMLILIIVRMIMFLLLLKRSLSNCLQET